MAEKRLHKFVLMVPAKDEEAGEDVGAAICAAMNEYLDKRLTGRRTEQGVREANLILGGQLMEMRVEYVDDAEKAGISIVERHTIEKPDEVPMTPALQTATDAVMAKIMGKD